MGFCLVMNWFVLGFLIHPVSNPLAREPLRRSLRSLLLGELVAKVLLAFSQIRLATVGVDERVRIAAEHPLAFLSEIKKAPVRTEKNIARQTVQ